MRGNYTVPALAPLAIVINEPPKKVRSVDSLNLEFDGRWTSIIEIIEIRAIFHM